MANIAFFAKQKSVILFYMQNKICVKNYLAYNTRQIIPTGRSCLSKRSVDPGHGASP